LGKLGNQRFWQSAMHSEGVIRAQNRFGAFEELNSKQQWLTWAGCEVGYESFLGEIAFKTMAVALEFCLQQCKVVQFAWKIPGSRSASLISLTLF
jgi:hypothetical protein